MDENKINGRVSDEDMALAVQKLLDEQKSLTEKNLTRLREKLTGMVTIINDNIDNIGAFSIALVAKEGTVLLDHFDAEEPVTEAMSSMSSYHKGRALLLAHLLKRDMRVLEHQETNRPSFPDFLAGILAGGPEGLEETEETEEPSKD